jgi:DNA-directed RNA polymerase specialized sigma24 family protein
MEEGRLLALVEVEAPWEDVGRAIESLPPREISAKAVLHVGACRFHAARALTRLRK